MYFDCEITTARRVIKPIACAVLITVAASCGATSSSDLPAPEPAHTWGPLGELQDLDVGAVAYIEARVTRLTGPIVTASDTDVDWQPGNGWPGVVVEDIESLIDLERPPRSDERDFFGELERLTETSSELALLHTDGAYDVDHRYGLVLGPGAPGTFIVLYGHDLESDRPVPGFRNGETEDAIGRLATKLPPGLTRSRGVAELARDLNRSAVGQSNVGLVRELLGATPPTPTSPRLPPGQLPRAPGEVEATPRELAAVSGFLIVDPDDISEYSLRFGGDELGWFAPDANGIVVIMGEAPVGARLSQITSRSSEGDRSRDVLRPPARPVVGSDGLVFVADLSAERRSGLTDHFLVGDQAEVTAAVLRVLEGGG